MRARADNWRVADVLCVSVGAFGTAVNAFCANLFKEEIQSLTNRCVALSLQLVFNVASQKNAISIGFCPFVHREASLGTNIGNRLARRNCNLEL